MATMRQKFVYIEYLEMSPLYNFFLPTAVVSLGSVCLQGALRSNSDQNKLETAALRRPLDVCQRSDRRLSRRIVNVLKIFATDACKRSVAGVFKTSVACVFKTSVAYVFKMYVACVFKTSWNGHF